MKIGVLLGDDIGLEVVPECVKVMQAAAASTGLSIDWVSLPDRQAWTRGAWPYAPGGHGSRRCASLDGWIMGPIGHNAYPRNDPTWVMPPIRKKFELFAAVRPALSHANVKSPHKDVDIIFVREITEGMLYSETVVAGAPEFRPNDDITISTRVITRKGSRRVAREAFEIARNRPRKKVTAAHKEPVYRLACGMFAEECRKVAREYPDVAFEEVADRYDRHEASDGAAAVRRRGYHQPVRRHPHRHRRGPRRRTWTGAGPCAGENQAMAQATHGSAPDIAGRNLANPYAMIMSGQMLLAWLGRKRSEPKAMAAAERIQTAVTKVVAEAKHLTADLGGRASTREMGDAIAEAAGR